MLYKRILLKLSGEGLSGDKREVFDFSFIFSIVEQIKYLVSEKVEIGIVLGGGNIWRGGKFKNLNRVKADNIGMLATIINSLVFSQYLQEYDIKSKVYSSIYIEGLVDKFNIDKILNDFSNKSVVIFAGGTGNSHFTTDTAAVLRAVQINADILFKATNVDGVYTKNPSKYKDAQLIDRLTYDYAIENNLKVMDLTSIALAKEYNLPLKVFNIHKKHAIIYACEEKNYGSIVVKEV